MTRRSGIRFCGAAIALFLSLFSAAGATRSHTFAGKWTSLWTGGSGDPTEFRVDGDRVTGSYTFVWNHKQGNGRIEGRMSGNTLTGTWIETGWEDAADGTHAGTLRFVLSSDGKSWTGTFERTHNASGGGDWNGVRVGAEPKSEPAPDVPEEFDLRGSWRWNACGEFSGTWTIASRSADGRFSGRFDSSNGKDLGTIEGSLSGDRIEFTRRWEANGIWVQRYLGRVVREGNVLRMIDGRWEGDWAHPNDPAYQQWSAEMTAPSTTSDVTAIVDRRTQRPDEDVAAIVDRREPSREEREGAREAERNVPASACDARVAIDHPNLRASGAMSFDPAGGPVTGGIDIDYTDRAGCRYRLRVDLTSQYAAGPGGPFGSFSGTARVSGTYASTSGSEAKISGEGDVSGRTGIDVAEIKIHVPSAEVEGLGRRSLSIGPLPLRMAAPAASPQAAAEDSHPGIAPAAAAPVALGAFPDPSLGSALVALPTDNTLVTSISTLPDEDQIVQGVAEAGARDGADYGRVEVKTTPTTYWESRYTKNGGKVVEDGVIEFSLSGIPESAGEGDMITVTMTGKYTGTIARWMNFDLMEFQDNGDRGLVTGPMTRIMLKPGEPSATRNVQMQVSHGKILQFVVGQKYLAQYNFRRGVAPPAIPQENVPLQTEPPKPITPEQIDDALNYLAGLLEAAVERPEFEGDGVLVRLDDVGYVPAIRNKWTFFDAAELGKSVWDQAHALQLAHVDRRLVLSDQQKARTKAFGFWVEWLNKRAEDPWNADAPKPPYPLYGPITQSVPTPPQLVGEPVTYFNVPAPLNRIVSNSIDLTEYSKALVLTVGQAADAYFTKGLLWSAYLAATEHDAAPALFVALTEIPYAGPVIGAAMVTWAEINTVRSDVANGTLTWDQHWGNLGAMFLQGRAAYKRLDPGSTPANRNVRIDEGQVPRIVPSEFKGRSFRETGRRKVTINGIEHEIATVDYVTVGPFEATAEERASMVELKFPDGKVAAVRHNGQRFSVVKGADGVERYFQFNEQTGALKDPVFFLGEEGYHMWKHLREQNGTYRTKFTSYMAAMEGHAGYEAQLEAVYQRARDPRGGIAAVREANGLFIDFVNAVSQDPEFNGFGGEYGFKMQNGQVSAPEANLFFTVRTQHAGMPTTTAHPFRFSIDQRTGQLKGGYILPEFHIGEALARGDIGSYPQTGNLVAAAKAARERLVTAIQRWDKIDRTLLGAPHLTSYLPKMPVLDVGSGNVDREEQRRR